MRTVGLLGLLLRLVCSGGSGDVIGWDGGRDGGMEEGVVMIVLAWVGLMLI